jgi:ribosomal protein L35AE/L33A
MTNSQFGIHCLILFIKVVLLITTADTGLAQPTSNYVMDSGDMIGENLHGPYSNRSLASIPFQTLRFNAGGPKFTDSNGISWSTDTKYATGGSTYGKTVPIDGTIDDVLYQTYRYGKFSYRIPIRNGKFEIVFHFAEINLEEAGSRLFSIKVQGVVVFEDVDLISLGRGKSKIPLSLETVASVSELVLNIDFIKKTNAPFVSAVEVKGLKAHLAHAVPNGPYFAVDTENVGSAVVKVDGSLSHTHGVGHYLESIVWKEGAKSIGLGDKTDLKLSVGEHVVALYVKDSAGDEDSASTTVTVFPFGFPAIVDVNPSSSNIAGGSIVAIYGTGFDASDANLIVLFGDKIVRGTKNVRVVSSSKIEVTVPSSNLGAPVNLSVQTSKGKSNAVQFTYLSGSPISFESVKLKGFGIALPTVLTFDSKNRLYIANSEGKIARLSMSTDFTTVTSSVISSVLSGRTILGIAFDPMSSPDDPSIYVSHSTLFHGNSDSTSGLSINGKVSRIKGANLDVVVDVVTNLPVSDHDHSVNGLEFGDNGELYIQVGGNTNAGIPGRLSGTRLLKENPLSAATLVAYLSDPKFDGNIAYDAPDNGNVVGGKGVKVFASGQRNSFDITLHSNGKLYATDNGPNVGYGKRSIGCSARDEATDPEERDKLNLIVPGGYYGHANRKRGEKDSKQCIWRSSNEPRNPSFKAPIMSFPSSTNGIIEFQTNHFEGQLRHNLIVS